MQKCHNFSTFTLQRSQKLTESNGNRPLRESTFMFSCIWDFFVFFVLSCFIVLSCTFMFFPGDFYVRVNGYGRFKVRAGPSMHKESCTRPFSNSGEEGSDELQLAALKWRRPEGGRIQKFSQKLCMPPPPWLKA